MNALAVLDTTYTGIDIEAEAASPWEISVVDSRTTGGELVADGVLVQYATIDAAYLDAHPSIRVIGRYGVGYDTVDVAAATARGVAVYNIPDYCVSEVATHAAALALASVRRLLPADALVRSQQWSHWNELRPIPDLSSLTLGLLGVGHIGAETARLLAPYVHSVIAYDPAGVSIPGIENVTFDELLARSNVLSLHCPLLPTTQHILNEETLSRLPLGAYVVNVSRGGLVDSTALSDALHSGHLGGAALDVLDEEPPAPDSVLLRAPNLILTNHIAWLSDASEPRLRHLLSERCASYLAGEPLAAPLNASDLNQQ